MNNINYMQVGEETHCLFCHLTIKDSADPNHAVKHLQQNDTTSPCTEKCGKYFNIKLGRELEEEEFSVQVAQPTEGWEVEFDEKFAAVFEWLKLEDEKNLVIIAGVPISNLNLVLKGSIRALLSQAKEEDRCQLSTKIGQLKIEGGNPEISGDDGNAWNVGYNGAISDILNLIT